MDSLETQALASDKNFQKLLQDGEQLLKAVKVVKYNKRNRNQDRTLAITSKAMMNLKGKRMKRRVDFANIAGVTKSQTSDEFIIHIPIEYDYRFSSPHKEELISTLSSAYQAHSGKVLFLWLSSEVTLRELATTKADKKKGINKIPSRETASNFRAALEEEKSSDRVRTRTLFSAETGRNEVNIDDFVIKTVIGRGSFGKVMLVEKKDNHKHYAMKSLRKDALIEKGQIQNTLTEKQVMEHINHPFLVNLEFAFTSDDKIFFIMAYMPGGELFFHLKENKKFPEHQARFYGASVALALGHLHSQRVIYRDLKPENVLLDAEGYAHLTDFGMAKILPEGGSTMSFKGTPEYLAPEIISNVGHGMTADWWSYGILLYEMMVGIPPFYNQNIQLMYELIQHGDLRFPTKTPLSEQSEDLIRRLLNRNPRERLGVNGVEELKSHPFFESINWDDILNKLVTAPFVPKLSKPTSTQYVDPEFLNEPQNHSVVPAHRMGMVKQHEEEFRAFNK